MMDMPEATLVWNELDPGEVIFSWDEPETGRHYHWAIEKLESYLKSSDLETIRINVDEDFAQAMPVLRGLELHRLERIPNDPALWSPLIFCKMPDNTGLLVDGNHRYFKAWALGFRSVVSWYVP
jgi:hypothetical protein